MHEFKKHLLGQMLIFQESLTLVCVPHFVLNTQEANTTVVFRLKKCLVTFHKLKTVVILQLKKERTNTSLHNMSLRYYAQSMQFYDKMII